MVTSILQAIGLFLVTNIDDIIVLSLFFARGAGTRGTTAAIATGQYLGFGAILAASVLVALGVTALLPEEAIAYFGLIPLLLGLLAAPSRLQDQLFPALVVGLVLQWHTPGPPR